MDAYDLGLRLKGLREKYKLSQTQVATRLNLSRSAIANYESNTSFPWMLSQSLRYYIIPQPIISLAWKTVLLSHLMDSPLHKKMTF